MLGLGSSSFTHSSTPKSKQLRVNPRDPALWGAGVQRGSSWLMSGNAFPDPEGRVLVNWKASCWPGLLDPPFEEHRISPTCPGILLQPRSRAPAPGPQTPHPTLGSGPGEQGSSHEQVQQPRVGDGAAGRSCRWVLKTWTADPSRESRLGASLEMGARATPFNHPKAWREINPCALINVASGFCLSHTGAAWSRARAPGSQQALSPTVQEKGGGGGH